jgi:signal transduction histidine kinase
MTIHRLNLRLPKPETRKRMFEPFHTTKPKGTGLGLAVTHKILDAHEAQIFVESELGLGTEFVISFPVKSFENQRPAPENKV